MLNYANKSQEQKSRSDKIFQKHGDSTERQRQDSEREKIVKIMEDEWLIRRMINPNINLKYLLSW